jgi:hypothetical protein
VHDASVPCQVLLAQELQQQQQQLAAQHLVAVGSSDVVELGLTLTETETRAPEGRCTDTWIPNDVNLPAICSFKSTSKIISGQMFYS